MSKPKVNSEKCPKCGRVDCTSGDGTGLCGSGEFFDPENPPLRCQVINLTPPKQEGPLSCGTYPYPVTACPSGGHFCAGTYFNYRNDAEHQSVKMQDAFLQGQRSSEAEHEKVVKQRDEAMRLLTRFEFIIDLDDQSHKEWNEHYEALKAECK